jgi:hypothetical protein
MGVQMIRSSLKPLALFLTVSSIFMGLTFSVPGQADSVPGQAESTHKVSNPLIRTCTTALGTFEVYPVDTDQIALCRWNKLVVDSQTLLSNLNGLNSEAASVILSGMTAPSCAAAAATEFVIPTGEILCFFSDDSRLSLEGLKAGLSDSDRLHLKEVLSAR